MLAVVAPGQGAQRAGVLADWLGRPAVAATIRSAGAAAGVDLVAADRPGATPGLSATSVAQPLLVALGVAAWSELALPAHHAPALLAGHSVGELTVATVGGALAPGEAWPVVAARAAAMTAAAAADRTGMVALTTVAPPGPRSAEGLAPVLERARPHRLAVANRNGGGQVVLAGRSRDVEAFVDDLARTPLPRTRVQRLAVAGAFHTAAMGTAVAPLRTALRAVTEARTPDGRHDGGGQDCADGVARSPGRGRRFVSALDGNVVDGPTLLQRLPRQVAAPVRWDLVLDRLVVAGVTGVLELPPTGTLLGLLRRAAPSLDRLALAGPEDLAAARAFCATHAPG